MCIKKYDEFIKESLPRQQSVDQLKKLRKLTKKTEDSIKLNVDGANLLDDSSPINRVESFEDYIKSNKSLLENTESFNQDVSKWNVDGVEHKSDTK